VKENTMVIAISNPTVPPRVSFSTLARLMGPITPAKQMSLLRDHKYPTDGPKRSYQNAREQLVRHLVSGAALAPNAVGLRPYETNVLELAVAQGVAAPAGCRCRRPSPSRPSWQFHGVEISMFPDVLLTGPRGTGAMKFHLSQETLPKGVGAAMAALLHHYQAGVMNDASAIPMYSIVLEPRQGVTYSASGNQTRLLQNVDGLPCHHGTLA
jgi:hypothetical protein